VKTSIYLPDEMAQMVRDRGISLSEVVQDALRGLAPAKASVIVPSVAAIRGVPSVEPVLEVLLNVVASGLPNGASALFLVNANLQAENGRYVDLGTAEPLFHQLSYGKTEAEKFHLQPRWRLSTDGIERLEQARDGGNVTLYITVRYGLMGGTHAPDWADPHRPVRSPSDQPEQIIIKAHDWVRDVLEPWHQAVAVSLMLAIPQSGATAEHRALITRLSEARRHLDAGQWKASVTTSREAVDLLRKMRPATVNSKTQQRTLQERESEVLDRLNDLVQALFAYDSAASHPDPHLRDIVWNRRYATLALGSATSLAQAILPAV